MNIVENVQNNVEEIKNLTLKNKGGVNLNINNANLRINGKLQWGNKIILHHPEWNGTPQNLNKMMINMGYVMCGYNYYVRKDGSVYE